MFLPFVSQLSKNQKDWENAVVAMWKRIDKMGQCCSKKEDENGVSTLQTSLIPQEKAHFSREGISDAIHIARTECHGWLAYTQPQSPDQYMKGFFVCFEGYIFIYKSCTNSYVYYKGFQTKYYSFVLIFSLCRFG